MDHQRAPINSYHVKPSPRRGSRDWLLLTRPEGSHAHWEVLSIYPSRRAAEAAEEAAFKRDMAGRGVDMAEFDSPPFKRAKP